MTIIQVFNNSVRTYPDNIAIKGPGFSYSYKELDELTAAFAARLISSGITRGDHVGICLPRSAEMIVGIFGILRAGAAYLPVDYRHPPQRITALLTMAGAKHVVTTANHSGFVESLGFVPEIPSVITGTPVPELPLPETSDSDTAYILFTSGSTGTPKGVMIAHYSVVNLISYIQNEYPLDPGDVVMLKSPYTFDGSVWELFGWMIPGGTLLVSEEGDEKDPGKLWQLIESEKVAFMFFVPSMMQPFLAYFSLVKSGTYSGSLKWVSVGGEVLPVQLVNEFYRIFRLQKTRLINVYGPTETTVYAITHLCYPVSDGSAIPLGKPVYNDFIYILDDNGNLCQAGEEGEIVIGGAGVGKGYLGNEELSNQRFVPDVFAGTGMMYRTGDIGRQDENGTFYFIGRKDFQVKLRGLRIELGEIEFALLRLEMVRSCVVLMSKDENEDDCIVAYLLLNEELSIAYEEPFSFISNGLEHTLRNELSTWLPAYMIPARFIAIRHFELTSHGKTNRSALPQLKELLKKEESESFHPQTAGEAKLQSLWKEVLGIKTIDPNKDFFTLGGHSLKAVQLISQIIKEYGVEVPLKDFFEGLTLQEMLNGLSGNRYPSVIPGTSGKASENSDEYKTLTPVQKEMWIMNNFDSTGLIHNIQIEFGIHGNPDVHRLIESLKTLLSSEEIFSSVFVPVNGTPYQKVLTDAHILVPYSDMSSLPEKEREDQYHDLVRTNGRKLFDTSRLPLYSVELVRLNADTYRILFAVHHLIFDGWSLYLFMQRLSAAYNQLKLPANPWRNADYAGHLLSPEMLDRAENERSFWRQRLSGLPHRWHIPLRENARPQDAGKEGDRFWWILEAELTSAIDSLANRNRTTPFTVFMTAFQLSLAANDQLSDVVVGTPFANRNHETVNQLIGYYTNMISIRLQWTNDMTLGKLISECSHRSVEAFTHATIPFGEIAKMKGKGSELGSNPVYQAIMVLQNWPHNEFDFKDFTLQQREIGNQTSKTDILLNIEKQAGAYQCWLEFDTNLYDRDVVEKLSDAINTCLKALVEDATQPVEPLSLRLKNIINPPLGITCYIIGEGKLAAHCVSVLLEKKVSISAVFSDDEWLRTHYDLKFMNFKDVKAGKTSLPKVDYIFSINNGEILKPAFLQLAKIAAINYHDSPLPLFAGMYATNWAILSGSSTHGVSWHLITGEIDAGDIVSSEQIQVLPEDDVMSLNTRCFEAAISSFNRLVSDIVNNRLTPASQNPEKRTYFPLAQRPAHFGCFYPDMTVDEASRLIKATNFGKGYDNPFGLPWIWINAELYIVAEAGTYKKKGTRGSFGMVENHAGFYCADGFIALKSVYDTSLTPINPVKGFSARHGMIAPDDRISGNTQKQFESIARYEPYWCNRFREADYLKWPFVKGSDNSRSVSLEISNTACIQLQQCFQQEDLKDVLTAVTLHLLLRLAGTEAGTVGLVPATLSGQSVPYFSSWVPLTVKSAGDQTGKEAISTLLGTIAEAERAQGYVVSLQLRYPSLKSSASEQPVILVYKGGEPPRYQSGRIIVSIGDHKVTISQSDHSGFSGMAGFLTFLEEFVNQFVLTPEMPLKQLGFISSLKMGDLIHSGALTEDTKYPQGDITHRFLQTAASKPHHPAVVDNGTEYSYGRLVQDVLSLAETLSALQVKEGTMVAIAMSRSYYNILSMLSVLHCGACFVETDPDLPLQRTRHILTDAGVSLILREDNNNNNDLAIPALNVVSSLTYEAAAVVTPGFPDFRNESPAYVIYTSGSTGYPKGVMITRRNLSSFIHAATGTYRIQPDDRILQFSSLSFDACIEEIFCSLCNGASLFLRTENLLETSELLSFSVKNELTIWDLPTSFWRQVIHTDEYKRECQRLNLRLVILGGEAVLPADLKCWKSQRNKHRLVNSYGPTETTVVALTHDLSDFNDAAEILPIGKPLQGYFALITDRHRQLMPAGIPGELLICGPGVAAGYLNRLEEMEKAFTELDLPGLGVQRCYCTGDIACYNEDGLFFYLGRSDNQVKIRGFRVELQEIENQIRSVEGIDWCMVLAEDGSSGKRLIAFVTGEKKRDDNLAVRAFLKERLPVYMIPYDVIHLNSVPFSVNGKVDKESLLRTAREKSRNAGRISLRPSNPTEEYISETWKSILEVHDLGVDDDFFESGGHSLNAVALMARISNDRDIRIPLASLIQNPTIRKFAAYLDSKSHKLQWNCLVPIRTEGSLTPVFLIHGAGLNILLYQSLTKYLDPDRPVYAFQASGLDGKRQLRDSIEAMAAEYVEELIKVQPEGPYCLLGFSMGGFIAYEMSQILLARGYKPDFTGMIDSVANFADFSDSAARKTLLRAWTSIIKPFYDLWLLIREPYESKSKLIKKKTKNLRLTIKYFMLKYGLMGNGNLHNEIGQLSFLSDKVLIFMNEALSKYKIRPSAFHIDLFIAGKPTFYIYDRKFYGWKPFAKKGITRHVLPGDHTMLFAHPHDKLFAGILEQRLKDIDRLPGKAIQNSLPSDTSQTRKYSEN